MARFIAPEELKSFAQGFNPGNQQVRQFALKGREITIRLTCAINSFDLGPLQGSSPGGYGSQG
jgi:hypothetical protein